MAARARRKKLRSGRVKPFLRPGSATVAPPAKVTIALGVSRQASDHLSRIASFGIFGTTPEEVAVRLLEATIAKLVDASPAQPRFGGFVDHSRGF